MDTDIPERQPAPTPAPSVDKPTRAPDQGVALGIAWLAFLLLTALPTAASLAVAGVVILWLFAATSLLHTGGLAMAERSFDWWWNVGLGLMLVSVTGAILRRLFAKRAPEPTRQRVVGPGGRVLRVFFVKDDAAPTAVQHPILSWLPDASVLASLFFVIVRWGEWGGNRLLPDGLSVLLIAANLYLFLLYVPLWLFRLAWRLCRGLLRFARVSEFRAGMFTVLFLLPVVSECGGLVAELAQSPSVPTTDHARSKLAPELSGISSFTEFNRVAMRATAEAFWSEAAFDADLRRYLHPWFAAGATITEPSELGRLHQRNWRLDSLGSSLAWAESEPDEDLFRRCIKSLYPGEVSRAERQVRQKYRFDRSTSYDVAVGALLSICDAQRRARYERPAAAYWRAVSNAANKLTDPTRRYRRELPSSALGAAYLDCGESESSYLDRCPSPWASPEAIAETWERLALTQFCELSRFQRTILVQKAVLGWSDVELADEHPELRTQATAKDTYQNIRRKVETKLDGMCRGRRGVEELLEGLQVR